VTVLFWIVFGAKEWRCYFGLILVLKSDDVIWDCSSLLMIENVRIESCDLKLVRRVICL